ncbi:MAG: glycoside hydrolase family 15 protein, partial [Actinomycetota bacterium]
YRYCWLRDATFTLEVLLAHGYTGEAREWQQWLLRAVAGDPKDLQIMYSVTGARRLHEMTLDDLAGYEESRPVRIGNAAHEQLQLDVYGEVIDSFHSSRRAGIETDDEQWQLEVAIIEFVCEHWREPDDGIWEGRSDRENHVHSKVMAWVAVDRGIAAIERFGRKGSLEHWHQVRQEIYDEIMQRGWSEKRGAFTRAYGDDELDASLLMMPIVGFLPADDPRMVATIEAIQKELTVDGLVRRYRTGKVDDGLPVGEGTFILCTFWLVDCLALLGRHDEACGLFERLLELSNDVGLLSEQYDTKRKRLVGNFPQAFSHVALATAAQAVEDTEKTLAVRRGE